MGKIKNLSLRKTIVLYMIISLNYICLFDYLFISS